MSLLDGTKVALRTDTAAQLSQRPVYLVVLSVDGLTVDSPHLVLEPSVNGQSCNRRPRADELACLGGRSSTTVPSRPQAALVHGKNTTYIECKMNTQDNELHGRALSAPVHQYELRHTALIEH